MTARAGVRPGSGPRDHTKSWGLPVWAEASAALYVPRSVGQIVVQGDHLPVVEDDRPVLPGDRLSPPLVVDPPAFTDDGDAAGRSAGNTDVDRLAVFVGAHDDGPGLTEGFEAGAVPAWWGSHGSKLSRA